MSLEGGSSFLEASFGALIGAPSVLEGDGLFLERFLVFSWFFMDFLVADGESALELGAGARLLVFDVKLAFLLAARP